MGLNGRISWGAGGFVVRCWGIAMGVFRDCGLFWYRLSCSAAVIDVEVGVFGFTTADLDSCSRMKSAIS